MRRTNWAWIVVGALVVASPGIGSAQVTAPPDRGPQQGRGRAGIPPLRGEGAVDPAKIQTAQELLDSFELLNADRNLDLAPQQYGQFIQRLKRLQTLRRQHQMQHARLVADLRRLVQQTPPVEDTMLDVPTKRIDDFDRQATQDRLAAYAAIDEILNLRQRARFRMFEERLEQQKWQILARVLSSDPAPGPGRGGG